jgi:hypothetical protein
MREVARAASISREALGLQGRIKFARLAGNSADDETVINAETAQNDSGPGSKLMAWSHQRLCAISLNGVAVAPSLS